MNDSFNTQKIEQSIDDLARITKAGFDNVDKRFEEVDKRFDKMDKRFNTVDDRLTHIDARLDLLERDVSHIRKHFVSRDEFDELFLRVEVIEKQLGIKPQS